MRITLLFCLAAVLQSCTPKRVVLRSGTDSPIVVSDGASTHLRHQGVDTDFQVVNRNGGYVLTVNDAGHPAVTMECRGTAVCTSLPVSLMSGWKLDVSDTTRVFLTIMSASPPEITFDFHGGDFKLSPDDSGDSVVSGHAGVGTDIYHARTFTSAQLTQGGMQYDITCPMPGSGTCKIRIIRQ